MHVNWYKRECKEKTLAGSLTTMFSSFPASHPSKFQLVMWSAVCVEYMTSWPTVLEFLTAKGGLESCVLWLMIPTFHTLLCLHIWNKEHMTDPVLLYVRLLLNVRCCQTKCLLICGRHSMPLGVTKPGLVYFGLWVTGYDLHVCIFFPHLLA